MMANVSNIIYPRPKRSCSALLQYHVTRDMLLQIYFASQEIDPSNMLKYIYLLNGRPLERGMQRSVENYQS